MRSHGRLQGRAGRGRGERVCAVTRSAAGEGECVRMVGCRGGRVEGEVSAFESSHRVLESLPAKDGQKPY